MPITAQPLSAYLDQANSLIDRAQIPATPLERCSTPVKDLLQTAYVIDVHTHFFDINCVNARYFLKRVLKDFLSGNQAMSLSLQDQQFLAGEIQAVLEGGDDAKAEAMVEAALGSNQNFALNGSSSGWNAVINYLKAVPFLFMKSMAKVHDHYMEESSLAEYFLPRRQQRHVITTALMMDLEIGWNVRIKKPFASQIEEVRELSKTQAVLPFLFCDPRRADLSGSANLYSLFNQAFAQEHGFFGVKIYPGLGYDPSDYRLWPIYELCQELDIPVLSHCGGPTISTENISLQIFEGEKPVHLKAKNRKEMAYKLNAPERWQIALDRFPNLKLNIAHFGGDISWKPPYKHSTVDSRPRKDVIMDFMKSGKYPHVYADFSYNLVEPDLYRPLRQLLDNDSIVRAKTLFGTDYWVVNQEGDLQQQQTDFLTYMDMGVQADLSRILAKNNPYEYLFGSTKGGSPLA
ncbi:MAG: amidohydrolase family protein [Bacteroidota bacterium]